MANTMPLFIAALSEPLRPATFPGHDHPRFSDLLLRLLDGEQTPEDEALHGPPLRLRQGLHPSDHVAPAIADVGNDNAAVVGAAQFERRFVEPPDGALAQGLYGAQPLERLPCGSRFTARAGRCELPIARHAVPLP
jgi:hypothetical protein